MDCFTSKPNQLQDVVFWKHIKTSSFIMFFPSDMSCVKLLRKELKNSLQENLIKEEDIFSIVLSIDEAVTNSISAHISNHIKEPIICRWKFENNNIIIYIMDYGKGLFINKKDDKNCALINNIESYLEKIINHQKGKNGCLPFNGIKKTHKNMGQGINLICSLMDTLKIKYHSWNDIFEDSIEAMQKNIDGSILEMHFKTSHKNLS